ncbi:MAG: hypothetical protein LBS74_06265 [Oscillospiraceae bacterium]|jgi:ABC-2 type transport system permease protein|nr:hypothetical protein [Oscillospiraceae bacterium]
MKNRFFDLKLFIEAIKQLKILGIVGTSILLLEALLVPVGYFILNTSVSPGAKSIISILEFNPLMTSVFSLMAPIMTLYIFKFLNSRKGSDFYHSIPNTRISIYVSFLSAVMAWCFIMILVPALFSSLGIVLLGKYVVFNFLGSVFNILALLAAVVLTSSAVALAMGLTGTTFSNVVFSLIILFVPRLLISFLNAMIGVVQPLVSGLHIIPFSSGHYNIVTSGFTSIVDLFSGSVTEDSYFSPSAVLYTLVLGAIYFVLAMLLFTKRKSEMATNPAINRIVQAVIRITCAMVVCLIPCAIIASDIIQGVDEIFDLSVTIFSCFVLYVIALVVYFLYEIISTRKWKNLLKAMVGLPILLGLNVAVIAGISAAGYVISIQKPTAAEISYVQVLQFDNSEMGMMSGLVDGGYGSYLGGTMSHTKLKNEKIKEFVSDSLKTSIDVAKNADYLYEYNQFPVAINYNGRVIQRNLFLTDKKVKELVKLLAADKEFTDTLREVPDPDSKFTTPQFNWVEFTVEENKKIYRVFANEIKTVPAEKLVESFLNGSNYMYGVGYMGDTYPPTEMEEYPNPELEVSLSVQTLKGISVYGLDQYISQELFPKTVAAYVEVLNKDSEKAISALVSKAKSGDFNDLSVGLGNVPNELRGRYSYYGMDEAYSYRNSGTEEFINALTTALKSSPKTVDFNKPYVHLSFSVMLNERTYEMESYELFMNIPDDAKLYESFKNTRMYREQRDTQYYTD